MDYHRDIAPLRSFHFGGDEVPKGAWEKSPACTTLRSGHTELKTASAMKRHFIEKLARIASKYETSLQGWEDAFYVDGKMVQREGFKIPSVVAHHWQNRWGEQDKVHRCNELANGDYSVSFFLLQKKDGSSVWQNVYTFCAHYAYAKINSIQNMHSQVA